MLLGDNTKLFDHPCQYRPWQPKYQYFSLERFKKGASKGYPVHKVYLVHKVFLKLLEVAVQVGLHFFFDNAFGQSMGYFINYS